MRKIIILLILFVQVSFLGLIAHADELALVDAEWLNTHIDDDDLVIVDVRPKADYLEAHIPNSLHTEYAKWREKRNGLPGFIPEDKSQLEALISELGINQDSRVVLVSGISKEGSGGDFGTAARIYWTLKIVGLKKLSILDGGIKQWTLKNYETTTVATTTKPSNFTIDVDYLSDDSLLATESYVQNVVKNKNEVLLDARPAKFYKGYSKNPFSRVSGTIKSSINISQFDFINEDGTFKSKEELEKLVAEHKFSKDTNIVSYCNTGHWAATAWFGVSEILGYQSNLYDGSLVEWTANKANPVSHKKSGFFQKLFG